MIPLLLGILTPFIPFIAFVFVHVQCWNTDFQWFLIWCDTSIGVYAIGLVLIYLCTKSNNDDKKGYLNK